MSAAREIKSIRAACFLSSRIEEMMAPSREEWRWISQRNEDTVERFFDPIAEFPSPVERGTANIFYES